MCLVTQPLIIFRVTFRIFSIIIAILSHKSVYQYTCTSHKISDSSDVQSTLQNSGSSVRILVHVTILVPRTEKWLINFLKNCDFPSLNCSRSKMLRLIITAALISVGSAQKCPYSTICADHTMCQYPTAVRTSV
jgi:hypothetical protein